MEVIAEPYGPDRFPVQCSDSDCQCTIQSRERYDCRDSKHPGSAAPRHQALPITRGRNCAEQWQTSTVILSFVCSMLVAACGVLAIYTYRLQNELTSCHARSHADSREWRKTNNRFLKTADHALKTADSVLNATATIVHGAMIANRRSDCADDRETVTAKAMLYRCEEQHASQKNDFLQCVGHLHVAQRQLSHCKTRVGARLHVHQLATQLQATDEPRRSPTIQLDTTYQHALDLALSEEMVARMIVWSVDVTTHSMARELLFHLGDSRLRTVATLRESGYDFPEKTKALVTAGKLQTLSLRQWVLLNLSHYDHGALRIVWNLAMSGGTTVYLLNHGKKRWLLGLYVFFRFITGNC